MNNNPNMFSGWDKPPPLDNQMTFSTGREIPFTRTPANVPASYIEGNEAGTSTKKRKSTSTSTSAAAGAAAAAATPRKTRTAPAKRIRRAPGKKPAAFRTIPHSIEDCGDADKTLIDMRDGGEDWKTIRERWEEITGEKTAVSTLPNRYARLKSNFTVIRSEDLATLLMAKREVEESFEVQKWDVIARCVEEKGGDAYAGVVLKRQYKKLMLGGGVEPPQGIRDADFEIEGEEDGFQGGDGDDDGDADMNEDE